MTKKDYILISEAVNRAYYYHSQALARNEDSDYMNLFIEILSAKLALENPRFDEVRFQRACTKELELA